MTIINDCLDNNENIAEGRGLFDIKNRIREIGGDVEYKKEQKFFLRVSLPKASN